MTSDATRPTPPRRRGAAATRALTLRVTAAAVAAALALTAFLAGRMALGQDPAIGGGDGASVAQRPRDDTPVVRSSESDDDEYSQPQQQSPAPAPVVTRTS